MRDAIARMGCPDPARKHRLSAFDGIIDAWNTSESPADLVWLAARIANTPRDRAFVALAVGHLLRTLPLESKPRSQLEQLLQGLAGAEEDPSELPVISRSLKPHVASLKAEYAKADRQARGRPSPATIALRAAASGLEAVVLISAGGWPSKSAEMVAAAIEETSKALGADSSLGLAQQLREHIPFAEFQTGWFSFGARSAD